MKTVNRLDKNSEHVRAKIEQNLKFQEGNGKILDWITNFRPDNRHLSVLAETKLDDEYSNQCQWLLDDKLFQIWEASIVNDLDENRVFWIKRTSKQLLKVTVV